MPFLNGTCFVMHSAAVLTSLMENRHMRSCKQTNDGKSQMRGAIKMKKKFFLILILIVVSSVLFGCSAAKDTVIIYTSTNDNVIAHMTQALTEKFPNYNIVIEYMSTSKHAAKLMAEGVNTECDIIHDLAYENMEQLNEKGILADLSSYDTSIYTEDAIVSTNFLPEIRCGGAIIVNTEVLAERGLECPTSYMDLLRPEYKDLISMPDPKATGSGYVFVKALANVWGDEAAIDYFDQLSENVLQFTSGSSGVTNALIQKEVGIGLTLISQAVIGINNGAPLEVIIPEEGSPYSMYGQAMVKGKEKKEAVIAVFDYLINEYNAEHCKLFYPEQIYTNQTFYVENYPQDIPYADMSNSTIAEKERLLEMWSGKIN